jgi:predicted P-loop ATPase
METLQPTTILSSTDLAAVKDEAPDAHVQRYLRFRGTTPGEVIGLEAIDPSGAKFKFSPLMLALSTDARTVERLAIQSDDDLVPKGCFVHQNELRPSVVARQEQDKWVAVKRGDGIKATHVASRRAFYFDLDPTRDDGVSSTRMEQYRAFERANVAAALLAEILGDDRPLGYGSSGNGAHVHVALASLANDAEVEALIRECLAAANTLLSDAVVKVDTTVCDARRVAPLFGTLKRKGAHYADPSVPPDERRPHRRTGFVCRDAVRRLTLEELRQLHDELQRRAAAQQGTFDAPQLPTPVAQTAQVASTNPSPWDAVKALDIEDVSDWLGLGRGSAMKCPGCGSTQGYGRVPGSNVTKCHHQRCANKGVPSNRGARTTIDLVVEERRVAPKHAVGMLAQRFGILVAPPSLQPANATAAPTAPPASSGAAWESGLLRDRYGVVKSLSANVELILANDAAWQGVVRFNEFANAIVFTAAPPPGFLSHAVGDEWRDEDDVACINWLQRQWGISVGETSIRGVVALVAMGHAFDPMKDSLRSLVWDGVSRLDTWLSKFLGAADTEYVRLVGRWWLISAVARALRPGCAVHHTLILEGAQGVGKSTVVQILAGEDYFLEDLGEVGSVECAKQLQGVWIIELSELDAMRKAEQTTIKRFITQRTDRFRPSYGRRVQLFYRRCVFIGTTNREDYLKDATGGRRFWPVRCGKIDLTAIARDRDQLWAEAVAMFESGAQWWPQTEAERALCGVEQNARYDEDVWTHKVSAFIREKKHVRTHEVLEAVGVEAGRMGGENAKRVGAILLRLGWEQERRRDDGVRERRWVRGPEEEARARVQQLFAGGASNVVQFPTGERAVAPATTPEAGEAQPDDSDQSSERSVNDAANTEYRDLLE